MKKSLKKSAQFTKNTQNLTDFFADKVALRVTYIDGNGNAVTKMMKNSEMKKLMKQKRKVK